MSEEKTCNECEHKRHLRPLYILFFLLNLEFPCPCGDDDCDLIFCAIDYEVYDSTDCCEYFKEKEKENEIS